MRIRNFTIFTVSALIFGQFRGNRSLHVGPSEKSAILNAGPTEIFLIMDHPKEFHNEREFKR